MDSTTIRVLLTLGIIGAWILVVQPAVTGLLYRTMALGAGPRTRIASMIAACAALAPLPLAIPPDLGIARLIIAMMIVTLVHKCVSFWVERSGSGKPSAPGERADFMEFAAGFTTNYRERTPAPGPGESTLSARALMAKAILKLSVVAAAVVLNVLLELWQTIGPLESTFIKFPLWILVLSANQDLVRAGLVRKGLGAGIVTVDPGLFWPSSHRDFIVRCNPITHRWLHRYIYLPLGGNRSPYRNIMICYIVSGLWHEYILSISSLQITGIWFAYFLINGALVALERALGRGRGEIIGGSVDGSPAQKLIQAVSPLFHLILNIALFHLIFVGLEQVFLFH